MVEKRVDSVFFLIQVYIIYLIGHCVQAVDLWKSAGLWIILRITLM